MPLPNPNKGEKQSDFMNRCVSLLTNKGEGESTEQRVAICSSQFRRAKAAEIVDSFSTALDEDYCKDCEESEDGTCQNHTTTPMKK